MQLNARMLFIRIGMRPGKSEQNNQTGKEQCGVPVLQNGGATSRRCTLVRAKHSPCRSSLEIVRATSRAVAITLVRPTPIRPVEPTRVYALAPPVTSRRLARLSHCRAVGSAANSDV